MGITHDQWLHWDRRFGGLKRTSYLLFVSLFSFRAPLYAFMVMVSENPMHFYCLLPRCIWAYGFNLSFLLLTERISRNTSILLLLFNSDWEGRKTWSILHVITHASCPCQRAWHTRPAGWLAGLAGWARWSYGQFWLFKFKSLLTFLMYHAYWSARLQ